MSPNFTDEKNGSWTVRRYSSLIAAAEHAATHDGDAADGWEVIYGTTNKRRHYSHIPKDDGSGDFERCEGGIDMESATAILKNGGAPEALVKKAKAALSAIDVPDMPSFKRKPVWTDDGDELCQDRLMSGQLDEAWRVGKRRTFNGAPRAARVLIEITVGGGNRDVFWRGAAGVAIVDLLESNGIPCEAWGYSVGTRMLPGSRNALLMFPLSREGCPIDLGAVATTAWMPLERVIAWRLLCSFKDSTGIGGCTSWPLAKEPGDIVIDQVFNKLTAERLLQDVADGIVRDRKAWAAWENADGTFKWNAAEHNGRETPTAYEVIA